jgi:two-component system, sensor histidine kinase PdtaS
LRRYRSTNLNKRVEETDKPRRIEYRFVRSARGCYDGDYFTYDGGIDRSLLYVAEFQHRINNEYAKVISFVSRLAALSPAPEAKAVLLKVIDHLNATSKVNYALRPPLPGELVDFTAHIADLCNVFASAGLKELGINLHLTISGSAILDAMRSWRASLIVAELITNSVRHGCSAGGRRIDVAVATNGVDIICQISDDGPSGGIAKPGVGSHLIDALADELKARISRSYTELGAVVALSFPLKPQGH